MRALEMLYDDCKKKGVRLVFSHVNEQPMRTMEKDGFVEKVGRENFAAHIDEALEKAAETK
jgi:SulP family sulfate permease